MLADALTFQVLNAQEDTASRLAHDISAHVVRQHQSRSTIESDNSVRGIIRCRQHMLQSTDDVAAGNQAAFDDDYFQTAYEADIQVDKKTGNILIHQRTRQVGEVAPVAQ